VASTGPILFFDGECGLCARSVAWCLRHDRRRVLRFAPLQGETYAALDVPAKPLDMSTMVLADENGLHTRSDAVLRMMRSVGGVWGTLAAGLGILPRCLTDWLYTVVSARRMTWFEGVDRCEFVRETDRERFLA